MKKTLLVGAALALGGTVAFGQVTQVVSRNAVGYVKKTVLTNNFELASLPFYEVGGDGVYRIPEVFGGQLNGGASFALSDNVMKFDPVANSYVIFWKNLSGQWRQVPEGVETTNTLAPGEAFFILNRKNTNQTVFLMGEVPDKFTVPTYTQSVNIIQGLQFASLGFPTEIAITDTTLSNNAQRGVSFALADNLITWEATTKQYRIYWLPSIPAGANWRKVPEGAATADTLKPGQGFFYNRRGASPFVWKEVKPYTWP